MERSIKLFYTYNGVDYSALITIHCGNPDSLVEWVNEMNNWLQNNHKGAILTGYDFKA